ncbi:MAG: sulfotransferase domain-containing protein [Lentisphaerales bacterium]|nr:sulfotransferase domain-containing protein [Lentisphaerales bacterium]
MSSIYQLPLKEKYIEVLLPEPSQSPSFFAFAPHKSGSVLLRKVLEDICDINKIPVINIPKLIFKHGESVSNINKQWDVILKEKGYAYLGFRNFPNYPSSFKFQNVKNILQVRDPRDMLVSSYFSEAFSHPLPNSGTKRESMLKARSKIINQSIDEYVLEKSSVFLKSYHTFSEKLPTGNTKIFRYEDIIFNKKNWIIEISNYLGLNVENDEINKILEKVDIVPAQENHRKHVRKVTPGDHKSKLSSKTIQKLNEIFNGVLSRYNYI